MSVEADYYELLEVTRGADDATIKSSYRKLAMRWHPDKNPGDPEAEARFKAISEAYDCLKDPQKRAAYDRFGHEAFKQGMSGGGGPGAGAGFSDLGDIFETIFGSAFGGGGGRQQQRRGADLRYDMEVALDEAFHGKQAEIEIEVAAKCEPCDGSGAEPGTGTRRCNLCGGHGQVRAQQGFFMVERTCPTCHGRGEVIEKPCRSCRGEGRVDIPQKLEVNIPPGVDTGTRIRLAGKGEAGPFGSPPGDLYIFIHVKRHAVFERDGTTLVTRVPIAFTTAALGGEIHVPTLQGEAAIDLPEGTQTGKQFRLRGKGIKGVRSSFPGDLYCHITVETPVKLTEHQRKLLKELDESLKKGGNKHSPNEEGWAEKLRSFFS